MLFIKIEKENNGAHASNLVNGSIQVLDGFAVVHDDLEQKAFQLLPWVNITITDGVITAIEDDVESRHAWETLPKPEQQTDTLTEIKIAIAELAITTEQKDMENKLAIAELAESLTGGV